jgi:3'-phosphoadenosine 5'-phosphosulfate sulfotransferase
MDLGVLLLGIHSKKHNSVYKRDNCKPMFIAILFTRVKLWNQLGAQEHMNGSNGDTQIDIHTHTMV